MVLSDSLSEVIAVQVVVIVQLIQHIVAVLQATDVHLNLSLGDREEHTKNRTMAAVGDNIRALHNALTQRGKACTLEWNAGGHFKDADLRTARAFAWIMKGNQ